VSSGLIGSSLKLGESVSIEGVDGSECGRDIEGGESVCSGGDSSPDDGSW
jgi:hypothetical protein